MSGLNNHQCGFTFMPGKSTTDALFALRVNVLKQFSTCKNDSRKTWKTINDLISYRKEKTSPTYFKDEHVIVTDKLEIANKFKLYFTKIGSNLAKDIHSSTNKDFASYFIKVDENISQFNFFLI